MADKNILDLPESSSTDSTTYLHQSRGGIDEKIPADKFLEQVNGGNPFNVTPKTESSTSRTLTLSDRYSLIKCTNAATTTITIPSDATAGWKDNIQICIRKSGLGDVQVVGALGVTVNPSADGTSVTEIGQTATLYRFGVNEWEFITGGNASEVLNATNYVQAEFSVVADFYNGGAPITTANGLTIDSSNVADYVGREVSTVYNNNASKAGGAKYVIWTLAAYRAEIGDGAWVPDGYAHHYFFNSDYVAILAEGQRLTPYHFGMVSMTSGVDYHNDAILAMLAYAKFVGGIDVHHDDKNFSYFIDRPIQLRGWLNMLGDFKITHSGTEGFPRNRYIEIQPEKIGSFNADSNNMTVGQNVINVTGNTMEVGDYMMILAGDDPYDPNEERYREIVRVDAVAGAAITFSPSFPGTVTSPVRNTTVHRFEHPCIGVKVGNVTFLEDSPLKTMDRCIQIEWCIGTEIGDLVTSYHAGTPIIEIESVDTKVGSITTMNKSVGAATSYARGFVSWGSRNSRVGSIRGSTDNISGIFLESFTEVEFGDINFPAFGAAGESLRLNGESVAKVKRFSNSIASGSGLVGAKADENSTLSIEYIDGVGNGALCSVGEYGEPPKVIQFADGEKYRFVGWCSRSRLLGPSLSGNFNITDVSGVNTLATHVSVAVDSVANLSGMWYGTASNEVDILAYANSYSGKQLPWSNRFGSSWPFNQKNLNTRIRYLTGASWPVNGYMHICFAQYQKV